MSRDQNVCYLVEDSDSETGYSVVTRQEYHYHKMNLKILYAGDGYECTQELNKVIPLTADAIVARLEEICKSDEHWEVVNNTLLFGEEIMKRGVTK